MAATTEGITFKHAEKTELEIRVCPVCGITYALPQRVVEEIAFCSKAAFNNVWRYFCGCCWREITRRQELARTLIEDGEV